MTTYNLSSRFVCAVWHCGRHSGRVSTEQLAQLALSTLTSPADIGNDRMLILQKFHSLITTPAITLLVLHLNGVHLER